jgi:hypothetical protein
VQLIYANFFKECLFKRKDLMTRKRGGEFAFSAHNDGSLRNPMEDP